MIESLESRIAPASIAVTFVKGLLTAKTLPAGDGAETVSISQPRPGDLQLVCAAGATFHINGMDVSSFTVSGVTGLSIALGEASDILNLSNVTLPKNLRIDLGNGTNLLTVGNGSSGGSLTVLGGNGIDLVNFNGSVGYAVAGKTNIALGAGNNKLTVTVPTFTAGDTFNLTSTTGNDTLTFDNKRLGFVGRFSAATGTGEDTLTVHATESLVFGRDVVIASTGTTAASIIKQSIKSDFDLVIGGMARLAATTGDVTQEVVADAGALAIARGLTMISGTGKSAQVIDSAEYIGIGGNVNVSTKAQGTASLAFTTGNNPEGTLIKGNIALTGHTSVNYYVDGTVTGSLTVRTALAQGALVNLGNSVSGDTKINGALTVTTAEAAGATSTVNIKGMVVGGTAGVFGSVGALTATFNDNLFFGRLTVDGKAGMDDLRLDTLGAAGTGVYGRPVVLRGGTGNDTITVGGMNASDTMIFRSTLLVDGGDGSDKLNKGGAYPASLPPTVVSVEF